MQINRAPPESEFRGRLVKYRCYLGAFSHSGEDPHTSKIRQELRRRMPDEKVPKQGSRTPKRELAGPAPNSRGPRHHAGDGAPSARKCPSLVSDVLLSHGLLRSTIGARGLNFRVRNGTGCTSPAMVADQRGAFDSQGPGPARCPGGRTAQRGLRQKVARPRLPESQGRRARPISTARLSASRRLHLLPINQVVYLGPYRREDSSRDWLPA